MNRMIENLLTLDETGEIWNALSPERKSQLLREMLESPYREEKPNFIDYSRGPSAQWKSLRPQTKVGMRRLFRRKRREM